MRNPTASSTMSLHLFSLVISSLLLFSSFSDVHAAVDRKLMAANTHDFHIIKVSSMLPDSVCDSSSQAGHKLPPSSLKVVHRYGPCHKQHKTDSTPSLSQILTHDEARVQSINARISSFNSVGNTFTSTETVTLPANKGASLGTANYVVTIGLGSPKKDLSLVFDTGSSLTWTQCEPCVGFCYKQHDPIFSPSESTSYANVSCNSATCNQLRPHGCSETTCLYGIRYGDDSSTVGYLVKDTLTLSPTETVTDFYFGCGQRNEGTYGQIAGLFGLGKNQFSVVSQTSTKYGNIFSYCLPSISSKPGYLTLGPSGISNAIQYTPLANSNQFYFIEINAIYVGGQKLAISPTVFSTYGSVIDSGTVITRFPVEAYTALRDSFRQKMSMYPALNHSTGIFDTCYDFSGYTEVRYPRISIEFGGNTKIDLDFVGIFVLPSLSEACLAFAVNTGLDNLTILGNVQQKTMQVVYDVAGGKLGFGPNGCA